MNDEQFMLGLDGLIENSLPENLSEIQHSILNATEQGILSKDEVYNIMNVHECAATDLMLEFERLQVIMEEDSRVPNRINFPKIDLIEHEQIMDSHTLRQDIADLRYENSSLKSNIQTIKQKLFESENKVLRLYKRGIISRILNRKV